MLHERFVEVPFLPRNKVTLVLIDERTPQEVKHSLHALGIKTIENPISQAVDPAICGHPDLFVHPLGGRKVLVHPDVSPALKSQLLQQDFEILLGNTRLRSNYPFDIAYNIARIGSKAFHYWKFTDPVAVEILKMKGVELINVKQGYSKCSVAIVGENAIISSDGPICHKAEEKGIHALQIRPGFIALKGMSHGFIGGTCGLLAHNILAFAGDIEKHPDGKKIRHFLDTHGIQCIALSSMPLVDIGSIIPLKEQNC